MPTTALEARADPDAQHLFAKVDSVGVKGGHEAEDGWFGVQVGWKDRDDDSGLGRERRG